MHAAIPGANPAVWSGSPAVVARLVAPRRARLFEAGRMLVVLLVCSLLLWVRSPATNAATQAAMACAFVVVLVVAAIRAGGLRDALRGAGPARSDAPWLGDGTWSREASRWIGPARGAMPTSRAVIVVVVLCGWCVVTLVAASLTSAGSDKEWTTAVALLPVAVLIASAPLQWLLLGRIVVDLPPAPAFVGDSVELRVGVSPGGARIDGVALVLRCVREVGPGPSSRVVLEVWSAAARLEPGAHLGPERFVAVRFDVPASAPGTDLRAAEPVYWELLVLGRVGGRAYGERVMVPVYARPAAGAGPDERVAGRRGDGGEKRL